MKISQLMGMDVYTDRATMVGKVYDAIIDLQKGEVTRLTLEPIKAASKDEAKRVFQEKTILYKNVKAVDRVVLISSTNVVEATEPEPEPEMPKKALPYSSKYRKTF